MDKNNSDHHRSDSRLPGTVSGNRSCLLTDPVPFLDRALMSGGLYRSDESTNQVAANQQWRPFSSTTQPPGVCRFSINLTVITVPGGVLFSLRISAFLCVSAVTVRGQPVYRRDAEERRDTQRRNSN